MWQLGLILQYIRKLSSDSQMQGKHDSHIDLIQTVFVLGSDP